MPYPCVVHFVLEAFNSVSEISRVDSDIIQFNTVLHVSKSAKNRVEHGAAVVMSSRMTKALAWQGIK